MTTSMIIVFAFIFVYLVLGFFLFRSINKNGLNSTKGLLLIPLVLTAVYLWQALVILFDN